MSLIGIKRKTGMCSLKAAKIYKRKGRQITCTAFEYTKIPFCLTAKRSEKSAFLPR